VPLTVAVAVAVAVYDHDHDHDHVNDHAHDSGVHRSQVSEAARQSMAKKLVASFS
jgi:hypothetical protein